jgi:cobalt-precorrin 5A hydrolase/precorrin-3B C17-methyltransferase
MADANRDDTAQSGHLALGFSLDVPPAGWHVANPQTAKTVTAALLAGQKVSLKIEAGDADWLTKGGGQHFADDAELAIVVTDMNLAGDRWTLVLHPPVLALGIGGERGVTAAEIEALVTDTLRHNDLSPLALACVVSLDAKEDAGLREVAETLGVPLRLFSVPELAAQAPRLKNPSAIVEKAVGVPGVAEGAALAAAGNDGTLIVPKVKSARATCAIARAAHAIDAHAVGRAASRP